MKSQDVSVIVPVLNQERQIAACLGRLASVPGLKEVIVVDGGSADQTVQAASSHPGVRVICAARGRALQMNAGAQAATGSTLLFLHPDVALPASTVRCIEEAF